MNKQGEHGIGQKLLALDFRQLAWEAKKQILQSYRRHEVPKFLRWGGSCQIDNSETDYDAVLIEKAICLALEKVKDR